MQNNPYYDYDIVREIDMFFGREAILYAIFEACIKRQSVSLVGTRKSGKSSLLRYLQSPEIQQKLDFHEKLGKHIFVYIDLRDYLEHNANEFFRNVYQEIMSHVPADLALQVTGNQGVELFKNILLELHRRQYHTVLLMDSFDKLEKGIQFGPPFFSFLRAPATQGRISYVTASLKPLYQISPDPETSPFFSGFLGKHVGSLTKEEAVQLITIPSARAGLPCDQNDVDWLLMEAGRHPFFLQRTCHHLYEHKVVIQQEGGEIDLDRVSQDIYEELEPFFNLLWKDLSPEQQRELNQEARQATKVSRKTEEFSESFLFRKYVCENFQAQQAPLQGKDIKEALDHLGDHAFLQNSILANMQYVVSRETANKRVLDQRGYLVDGFLRAAFEHMKPAGEHNDTSDTWRYYNILYYRYFRYQLTHDMIAARLGISRRQCFRDQDKAIELLSKALLQLDASSF